MGNNRKHYEIHARTLGRPVITRAMRTATSLASMPVEGKRKLLRSPGHISARRFDMRARIGITPMPAAKVLAGNCKSGRATNRSKPCSTHAWIAERHALQLFRNGLGHLGGGGVPKVAAHGHAVEVDISLHEVQQSNERSTKGEVADFFSL